MELTIGETLRIEMKRGGISQTELAEKMGLDKRVISKTLKNFDENKGNIQNLIQYVKALNLNIEFKITNLKQESEE